MFAGGADGGNGHLPRPRRARRGGGGGGGMGSPPLGPPPPPCTDYDMAYFKAYSHIGVHEEMLKVSRPTCASLSLSLSVVSGSCWRGELGGTARTGGWMRRWVRVYISVAILGIGFVGSWYKMGLSWDPRCCAAMCKEKLVFALV